MREPVLDTSRVTVLEVQDRTKGIGGTDSAGILGVSPWSSPLQVYRDKVASSRFDRSSNRMKLGNVLEPFVLQQMEEQMGLKVTHGQTYVRDRKKPFMLGSLDGIAFDPELDMHVLLEAKTTSHEQWDEIPPYYWLQVQHYLGLTGLPRAYLGALFLHGEFPLVFYPVDASEEAWEIIQDADEKFWTDNVLPQRPPEPNASYGDRKALEDLWPSHTPGAVAELGPEWIGRAQRLDELVSVIKEAEDEKAALENLLKMEIGEAEYGRIPTGDGWTYRMQERKEYTVAASTFRVLRRTKPENIAKAMKALKKKG
ncbi:MAG: hypothetical protein A2Y78_06710 [Acidobacteria bacterium RBG_13_68_16]|nr:MAG: hypothetical protein A2Y78_06710 [Acidobacteria bacterium RBG_13_68_16]